MKHRKRIIALLLAALMLCSCAACGKKDEKTKKKKKTYGDVTAFEVCMSAVFSQHGFAGGSVEQFSIEDDDSVFDIVYGDANLADYMTDFYYAGSAGGTADEVAVAIVQKEENRSKVKKAFEDRLESRIAAFTGYEPLEVEKLKKGKILEYDRYIIFLVCDNQGTAVPAIERALAEDYVPKYISPSNLATPTPTPTPSPTPRPVNPHVEPSPEPDLTKHYNENYEVGYNPLIIEAYKTGNRDLLTENEDLWLYDTCSQILEDLLGGKELTFLQAEKAIYKYIVQHVDYDYGHYSIEGQQLNSDNPIGALYTGLGICTGYSTTFNLLCSMIGMEVINVGGSAYAEREEHGWNMIHIGDYWYYVDPCWGWNGSGYYNFSYLNQTEKYMISTEHYWNKAGLPEADVYSYEDRLEIGFEKEPEDDPRVAKIWVP